MSRDSFSKPKTPTFVYVLQPIVVMVQERTGRVEVAQEVGVVFRKECNDKEPPDQEMKETGRKQINGRRPWY